MAAISMRDVAKQFGKTEVIKHVQFDINDGEFAVFVGPSGCGKSTLLRLIAGLEEVSSGNIAFDNQDVTELPPPERGVAMVFQSYALYPHMTVFDNMAFGLKLAKTNKSSIAQRVKNAAAILQIEHLLERKPRELSGGQRQRVAIGRAIVRQPRVFLFDEPLSNLDASLRVQMRLELKRLHGELGTTMIYVTHDQVEAMTLADRIVVLNGGVVEQVGAPLQLYHHPRNLFVAGFIGSPKMNFLSATVAACGGKEGSDKELSIKLDSDKDAGVMISTSVAEDAKLKLGEKVTLGLRPEHLSLAQPGAGQLEGTAIAVEHLGSEAYVHLKLDQHSDQHNDQKSNASLVFKVSGDTLIKEGQLVAVAIPPQACYLFDQNGMAIPRVLA